MQSSKRSKSSTPAVLDSLVQYLGRSQYLALAQALRGEEREGFREILTGLRARIDAMPRTYETDGTESDGALLCHLHYFTSGSDWWIIEKDRDGVSQTFGFTCLNGDLMNAELGYIDLRELRACGAELDLYFAPMSLRAIRAKLAGGAK